MIPKIPGRRHGILDRNGKRKGSPLTRASSYFKLVAAVRRHIAIAVAVAIVVAAKNAAQVKIAVQNVQQDERQDDDPGFVFVFTAGHEKASLSKILSPYSMNPPHKVFREKDSHKVTDKNQ